MVQHLCDRCKEIIDPKTGLIPSQQLVTIPTQVNGQEVRKSQYTEKIYKDGESRWRFTVSVKPVDGYDLCRQCVVAVILGQSWVEPGPADA